MIGHLAAEAEVRDLADGRGEDGRYAGVHRVAAAGQHAHARFGREVPARRHHPDPADHLGPEGGGASALLRVRRPCPGLSPTRPTPRRPSPTARTPAVSSVIPVPGEVLALGAGRGSRGERGDATYRWTPLRELNQRGEGKKVLGDPPSTTFVQTALSTSVIPGNAGYRRSVRRIEAAERYSELPEDRVQRDPVSSC